MSLTCTLKHMRANQHAPKHPATQPLHTLNCARPGTRSCGVVIDKLIFIVIVIVIVIGDHGRSSDVDLLNTIFMRTTAQLLIKINLLIFYTTALQRHRQSSIAVKNMSPSPVHQKKVHLSVEIHVMCRVSSCVLMYMFTLCIIDRTHSSPRSNRFGGEWTRCQTLCWACGHCACAQHGRDQDFPCPSLRPRRKGKRACFCCHLCSWHRCACERVLSLAHLSAPRALRLGHAHVTAESLCKIGCRIISLLGASSLLCPPGVG